MNKKIIIGCANVGHMYGLRKKQLSLGKFDSILKVAKKNNLIHFDTASDYSKSELFLGKSVSKLFKKKKVLIDTKLPKFVSDKNLKYKIKQAIFSSIKKLGVKKINILYIHNPRQLTGGNGKIFYKTLLLYKKRGLINKIGVSVYTVKEIKIILRKYKIDAIQAPVNILDNRFTDKKLLNNLKKRKISFIARSIFLKGLVVKDPRKLPKYFNRWKKKLMDLNTRLRKNKLNIKKYTFNYILRIKNIDSFIIGVSSPKQLIQLLGLIRSGHKITSKINTQNVEDLRLIDPRYWINS